MTPTKTSAILLAGGVGSRMHADQPKQFLILGNKAIAQYSFEIFMAHPHIHEIIVVCSPCYQDLFSNADHGKPVHFALPGARRQDSVYNGLLAATHPLVCIHDAARPFMDHAMLDRVLTAANETGAATTGMPVKFTIKEATGNHFVKSTPDRAFLWEIQTPQAVKAEILHKGFEEALSKQLTVTDDVSLAELLGYNVKLVEGSHANLKITVPSDLAIASHLLRMCNTDEKL